MGLIGFGGGGAPLLAIFQASAAFFRVAVLFLEKKSFTNMLYGVGARGFLFRFSSSQTALASAFAFLHFLPPPKNVCGDSASLYVGRFPDVCPGSRTTMPGTIGVAGFADGDGSCASG